MYAGELDDARGHDGGDRITALASAGTACFPSNQKVILTRAVSGSICSDLADRNTKDADLVTDEDAVAVGEVSNDDASPCGAGAVQQHRGGADDHQDQHSGPRWRGCWCACSSIRPSDAGPECGGGPGGSLPGGGAG